MGDHPVPEFLYDGVAGSQATPLPCLHKKTPPPIQELEMSTESLYDWG